MKTGRRKRQRPPLFSRSAMSVTDVQSLHPQKKRKREHDGAHHLAATTGDPSSSSHPHHQLMHRNSTAPTPAAHLPTPGGAPPIANAAKRGIVRKERDEPPGSASGIPPSKKRRQVCTLSYTLGGRYRCHHPIRLPHSNESRSMESMSNSSLFPSRF